MSKQNNELQPSGTFRFRRIDGAGEFRLLIHENKKAEWRERFYFELIYNPTGYGLKDFCLGWHGQSKEEGIRYFNSDEILLCEAKACCKCRIDAKEDKEGVYEESLSEIRKLLGIIRGKQPRRRAVK